MGAAVPSRRTCINKTMKDGHTEGQPRNLPLYCKMKHQAVDGALALCLPKPLAGPASMVVCAAGLASAAATPAAAAVAAPVNDGAGDAYAVPALVEAGRSQRRSCPDRPMRDSCSKLRTGMLVNSSLRCQQANSPPPAHGLWSMDRYAHIWTAGQPERQVRVLSSLILQHFVIRLLASGSPCVDSVCQRVSATLVQDCDYL